MSIRLMTRVWDEAPYEQSTLLVLLSLADSANDDGVCWPSVPRLAERARVKDRQVQKALRKLEADGWLRREERMGRSTVYTVIVPESKASSRTDSTEESVPQDGLTQVNRPPGRGVPQDTPVPQDTGGVSPRTPGGVPQDTQNHKEPSPEPSTSTPPPPYLGGGMPRIELPWYPTSETAALAKATYPWATDVVLREVTGEFINWITVKAKQRVTVAQLNEDREKYSGIWFGTFLAKESENRERAARDEAAAREPEKKSWFAVAGD